MSDEIKTLAELREACAVLADHEAENRRNGGAINAARAIAAGIRRLSIQGDTSTPPSPAFTIEGEILSVTFGRPEAPGQPGRVLIEVTSAHDRMPMLGIGDVVELRYLGPAAKRARKKSENPISPKEAKAGRAFPDAVYEAFNELIVEGRGHVRQRDAIARILSKMPDIDQNTIFKKGWLDIEDAYRAKGWDVIYDKPGFNEHHYEPFFKFEERK